MPESKVRILVEAARIAEDEGRNIETTIFMDGNNEDVWKNDTPEYLRALAQRLATAQLVRDAT